MQKKRLILLMVLGISILGLASCTTIPRTLEEARAIPIPLPSDIKIIPPSPDLPREIAAFSGQWIGIWGGLYRVILVVEEITEKEAKIIYAHEAYPLRDLDLKAKYRRYVAKVVSGANPEIELEVEAKPAGWIKFRFEMKKDLNTLKALREYYKGGGWEIRTFGNFRRVD